MNTYACKPKYKMDFTPSKNGQQLILVILSLLVAALLYCRDAMGVSVSKYIFCVLIIPYVFYADINNVLILWSFIMPLYVGLPGNIILPCILLKLILQRINTHKVFYIKEFLCTIFLMCFMLFQNLLYGYVGMYNMICIIELMLVYKVLFLEDKSTISTMIIAYSLGVALTGIIMLSATLKHVDIIYLLNVATRLGDYEYSEGMSINIDPNFYGLFAITVLSSNWLLIRAKIYTNTQKVISFICIICSIVVGLIGLSRGFVLGLALWSILTIVFEKSIKMKVIILLFAGALIVSSYMFFPDVVEALKNRFNGADTLSGNGRIGLMQLYGDEWKASFHTILFGIGLFVSESHCMQAQFLFGIGIVGTIPLFTLGFWYWKYSMLGQKITSSALVPLIIIQVIAGLLPAARSLTYMMPVVISLLVLQAYNYKLHIEKTIEQGDIKNECEKKTNFIRNEKASTFSNGRFRYIL